MLINKTKVGRTEIETVEFSSLIEFRNYILNTPFSETWKNESVRASVTGSEHFTKTKSFDEALELFDNGWDVMAKTLTQRLKAEDGKQQIVSARKSVLDVAGYQPIVPLYLNNVPTNMINRKSVPVKQKVVTINKSINYSARITADVIVEESLKALMIVKRLEAQGMKVNLNIFIDSSVDTWGTSKYRGIVRIRVKNAGERLNVSKLAFVLVHPSMLRRLLFRFIEVHPTIPVQYINGYGRPTEMQDVQEQIDAKEYLLPPIVKKDISRIRTLDDLCDLEKR